MPQFSYLQLNHNCRLISCVFKIQNLVAVVRKKISFNLKEGGEVSITINFIPFFNSQTLHTNSVST